MQTSYGRHDYRGRHRCSSGLCTCQHGRDHRVLVGRVGDRTSVGRASVAANSAEKSNQLCWGAEHVSIVIAKGYRDAARLNVFDCAAHVSEA